MSTIDNRTKNLEPSKSPTQCNHCSVRHHSICGVLNEEELIHLNQIARPRKLKAGDVIVSDEEPIDYFANVISGVVKLSKFLPDGRQQIVGLLFPPGFSRTRLQELQLQFCRSGN